MSSQRERNMRKSVDIIEFKKAVKAKLERELLQVGKKLSPRARFRAAIRLVIEYREWIGDQFSSEEIGGDVTRNVKRAQRKKADEHDLTVEDRAVLLIPRIKRSRDNEKYLEHLIKEIRAFKKYPEDVRETVAAECDYLYAREGKTIIRQGHKALALYYVARGQLQILKDVVDEVTGEVTQIEVGLLERGDIFGQIALLHNVRRTATVVSKTSVDLLLIKKNPFNEYLKFILREELDALRDALVNFNYFKGWSEETMRDCCILSRIVDFKPDEILLGDGRGMIHYVHFLLSGECRLIEHFNVEKKRVGKKIKYKLYESVPEDKQPRQRVGRSKKIIPEDELKVMLLESDSKNAASNTNITTKEEASTAAMEYIKMISTNKPSANVNLDKISIITVTLQDVINQWHEITDVVEMLMKKPSVTSLSLHPKNVETVFMQICTFYRGACFGLGEQMKNRRVVSVTPSKCLLIPRYWLTQHNRANIWERVKLFMNSKFPDNKELLSQYIENKAWAKHRREYVKNLIDHGRRIPNDTKNYDVPYSIRINDDIVDD